MESLERSPRFDELEIWVLNTEYKLFDEDRPRVDPARLHWGRLDEMSKVVGVAPCNAAVRLFWADAVVSVDGADLSRWTGYTGRRAPSEQQLSQFLWHNIQAAAKGDCRTRSFKEAKSDWDAKFPWDSEQVLQSPDDEPVGTTPGVYVWRNSVEDIGELADTWPVRPTGINSLHFLRQLQKRYEKPLGILLDYPGAELRYVNSLPTAAGPDPRAAVVVLGGPKGISQAIKEQVQLTFSAQSVPLLEVSLGPYEEMAHACVAFLRLQEDAGRLKAAVTDLHQLGHAGYKRLADDIEAAWVSKAGVEQARMSLHRCCKRRRIGN